MAILQINQWNQQTHCRSWKGYGNTTDKPVEPADTVYCRRWKGYGNTTGKWVEPADILYIGDGRGLVILQIKQWKYSRYVLKER